MFTRQELVITESCVKPIMIQIKKEREGERIRNTILLYIFFTSILSSDESFASYKRDVTITLRNMGMLALTVCSYMKSLTLSNCTDLIMKRSKLKIFV